MNLFYFIVYIESWLQIYNNLQKSLTYFTKSSHLGKQGFEKDFDLQLFDALSRIIKGQI